jgi:2-keto-4-pentenoate hydratase/2-oxohepta-3-ene-1,7-dioic acid hydratase in catechol pathway
MRFVGYIQGGVRHIGTVLDAAVTPVGTIDSFYQDPRAALGSAGAAKKTLTLDSLVQTPPVPLTSRSFCVGINYLDPAEEANRVSGFDLPKVPMIFGRWFDSLVVDGTAVPLPKEWS